MDFIEPFQPESLTSHCVTNLSSFASAVLATTRLPSAPLGAGRVGVRAPLGPASARLLLGSDAADSAAAALRAATLRPRRPRLPSLEEGCKGEGRRRRQGGGGGGAGGGGGGAGGWLAVWSWLFDRDVAFASLRLTLAGRADITASTRGTDDDALVVKPHTLLRPAARERAPKAEGAKCPPTACNSHRNPPSSARMTTNGDSEQQLQPLVACKGSRTWERRAARKARKGEALLKIK